LHKEISGALFCSECGAQLIFPSGVPTSSIKTRTGGFKSATGAVGTDGLSSNEVKQPVEEVIAPLEDGMLTLNILGTGDVVSLKNVDEVILGRVSEGQPVVPDIDLTPFKAYEAGVSRMHASIRSEENLLTITDLGSANGTRINGRQITSHIPYPLKHGDILTLGKFKIQVLVRTP
jgi:pSer/pThr/pTyr-binding forkhead associated (FHA) protein